jgi:hypothetical protein
MQLKSLILMAVMAISSITLAPAQSPDIRFNLGPAGYNCGSLNTATYLCDFIPVVQYVNGAPSSYGTLNIEPFYQGRYDFVLFNLDGLGQAKVTNVVEGPLSLQITFEGTDFSGTMTLTYTTSTGCSGGRGGGCAVRWTITGGTIAFN